MADDINKIDVIEHRAAIAEHRAEARATAAESRQTTAFAMIMSVWPILAFAIGGAGGGLGVWISMHDALLEQKENAAITKIVIENQKTQIDLQGNQIARLVLDQKEINNAVRNTLDKIIDQIADIRVLVRDSVATRNGQRRGRLLLPTTAPGGATILQASATAAGPDQADQEAGAARGASVLQSGGATIRGSGAIWQFGAR